jgi:hypothetical protein
LFGELVRNCPVTVCNIGQGRHGMRVRTMTTNIDIARDRYSASAHRRRMASN